MIIFLSAYHLIFILISIKYRYRWITRIYNYKARKRAAKEENWMIIYDGNWSSCFFVDLLFQCYSIFSLHSIFRKRVNNSQKYVYIFFHLIRSIYISFNIFIFQPFSSQNWLKLKNYIAWIQICCLFCRMIYCFIIHPIYIRLRFVVLKKI